MPKMPTYIIVAMIAAFALSSCANTIRGAGRDASNTKDAVEDTMN
jgi:predicted small secreted protein